MQQAFLLFIQVLDAVPLISTMPLLSENNPAIEAKIRGTANLMDASKT